MKLFYSPGACSLVPQIALIEADADYEPVRVMLADGEHLRPDYLAINPRARVPALAVDGDIVTENVAILNYLADRFGADGSVPRGDPMATARCNEWLGWFASSVHISFAAIWRPGRFSKDAALADPLRTGGLDALAGQFADIEAACGPGWIAGDRFTAADSYALTFYRWGRRVGMEMAAFPRWTALVGRVLERPGVARALAVEGLGPSDFLAS